MASVAGHGLPRHQPCSRCTSRWSERCAADLGPFAPSIIIGKGPTHSVLTPALKWLRGKLRKREERAERVSKPVNSSQAGRCSGFKDYPRARLVASPQQLTSGLCKPRRPPGAVGKGEGFGRNEEPQRELSPSPGKPMPGESRQHLPVAAPRLGALPDPFATHFSVLYPFPPINL